jgi:hypothetical protein
VANDGNVETLGALVILPATFTGSPRNMHEYTQDAMAYVRTYGRSYLCITFTCNPAWTEIKEMLTNGQSPSEHHDLIARVFRQKQLTLIHVITDRINKYMGKCVCLCVCVCSSMTLE